MTVHKLSLGGRLSLEWNSIGVQESDVKILSEALSINGSLRVLDLRSNHIDHTGATHLANMLLQNNTLEDLGESLLTPLMLFDPNTNTH